MLKEQGSTVIQGISIFFLKNSKLVFMFHLTAIVYTDTNSNNGDGLSFVIGGKEAKISLCTFDISLIFLNKRVTLLPPCFKGEKGTT